MAKKPAPKTKRTILFLDDNPARHAIMDKRYPDDNVVHVYDIYRFCSLFSTLQRFDVVSLDHDLNEFTEPVDDFPGHCSILYDGTLATGLDACGYMAKFKDKLPSEVIVHSHNGNGARAMVEFLDSKGIPATWKFFDDSEDQKV